MRIGVYSGCFDPLTFGHLWVIDQGVMLFDKLHVVVGSHLQKQPLFDKELREYLIGLSTIGYGLNIDSLKDGENILDHIAKMERAIQDEVFLLRGIRNSADFGYEKNINQRIYEIDEQVNSVFVIPPAKITDISSSRVRFLCEEKKWDKVKEIVPPEVYAALQHHYEPKSMWLVNEPKVASIFESGTAGFAPTDKIGNVVVSGVSHEFTIRNKPKCEWCNDCGVTSFGGVSRECSLCAARKNKSLCDDKTRNFFNTLLKNGFIQLAEIVTADQVREMLDPVPFPVVSSEIFHLRTITLDSVMPLGGRHLPQSKSVGPIIADINITKHPGEVIIIEGKHRWLDALDRGDVSIMAWVGQKAIDKVRFTC